MITLQALLSGLTNTSVDCTVTGLSSDSRTVLSDEVFIALSANEKHLEQALARGVSVVLHDAADSVIAGWAMNAAVHKVAFVAIPHLSENLGNIAARFHGQPASQLEVIGITGTNGKTSCSQFLGQLLDDCGIIGTLGWGEWGNLVYTGYTTPDALMTQAILANLAKQGKQFVAMEVSSHGLAEGRVNGVQFKGVVLTNISRDHLDFHGSMEAYIATKQQLFIRTEPQFAVFNLNDPLSESFMAVVPEQVAIYGFKVLTKDASIPFENCVSAQQVRHQAEGLFFELGWQGQTCNLNVPLYGSFNVENILAVVAVMLALGYSLTEIVSRLQHLQPVNGRMQRFGNPDTALIFVDYAHTPDALEKALASARQHCERKLWVVFGCGGDRDTGKRPMMGACAEKYADQIIISDDNPRSENPEAITADILSACQSSEHKLRVIHDRALAIQTAIKQAAVGDCIVIAGKGHEEYQEIGAQKIPFSDAQVVMNCLAKTAVSA